MNRLSSPPLKLTAQPPVLALSDVSVTLAGRQILHAVSASIEPGEFIGVIGSNGAGKTTLLRLILGLLPASAGQVTVLGQPITHGNRAIGYVPQKAHLDPDTPLRGRDLVALGLDGERWGIPWPSRQRRARVDEVLQAVGSSAYADAPVGRLSGGEQQRLLIAQALLTQPRLLLLDEPLSNLDLRSAREVIQLVDTIRRTQNVAVMLVAHDMNPLLQVMDRVFYLAQGRAAIGTVADVVTSPTLSALYGYPVDVLNVRGRIVVLAGETLLDDAGPCANGNCGDEEPALTAPRSLR